MFILLMELATSSQNQSQASMLLPKTKTSTGVELLAANTAITLVTLTPGLIAVDVACWNMAVV